MKKALGILAATAFAVSAISAPALADKGGVPNENANCHARALAWVKSLDDTSTAQAAALLNVSVKDLQNAAKGPDGEFICYLLDIGLI